jgi:pimeloyl-ACP methyl ester carboxylesterase/DNA-binding CsgD family transcriptional regulator
MASPSSSSFADRLRKEAKAGDSVALLTEDWEALARELADDEDELQAAFHDAVSSAGHAGGSAVAPAEALAIGVVRADGVVEQADAAFAQWFGGAAELEPLLGRARERGAALGLVEDAEGEAAAAWAGQACAATHWPLSDAARAALAAGRERMAVVVFAPSRSSDLAERAACAFDLTAAEAKLAQAILFAPSLEIAAAQIGIGRETARDTLKRVMAKAGAQRLPSLLARLTELMGSVGSGGRAGEQVLVEAFGVSPSEARCAALIAAGATAKETAEAFGLSPETVKSYVKAVLGRTGLSRAKDLSRLLVEARELAFLADVLDPVFEPSRKPGRLRVIAAPEGRQLAFMDYGPRSGRPVFVFHGYAAGRTLPPDLVAKLQCEGSRPIVPQRPGFGLTSPHKGVYVEAAADDLKLLCEELRAKDPIVVARDGGVAVALEFARRHPGRVGRYVLVNPRTPLAYDNKPVSIADLVSRGLLGNPKLVEPVTELLRRHSDSKMVESNLRRTCSQAAIDIALLEDRAIVDGLVRDIQALVARSSSGFASEHAVFANGWTPPQVTAGRWTVLSSTGLGEPPRSPWENLPDVRFGNLEGAGFLLQFTHVQELVAAIKAA